MDRLTRGEQGAALLLGYSGVVGLLLLHRPWTGDPRVAWVWAGVGVAGVLGAAGVLGRRGLAAVAAFLGAAAPWDFAYPFALPFLVLGVVLLVRRATPTLEVSVRGWVPEPSKVGDERPAPEVAPERPGH